MYPSSYHPDGSGRDIGIYHHGTRTSGKAYHVNSCDSTVILPRLGQASQNRERWPHYPADAFTHLGAVPPFSSDVGLGTSIWSPLTHSTTYRDVHSNPVLEGKMRSPRGEKGVRFPRKQPDKMFPGASADAGSCSYQNPGEEATAEGQPGQRRMATGPNFTGRPAATSPDFAGRQTGLDSRRDGLMRATAPCLRQSTPRSWGFQTTYSDHYRGLANVEGAAEAAARKRHLGPSAQLHSSEVAEIAVATAAAHLRTAMESEDLGPGFCRKSAPICPHRQSLARVACA
mmetsp:Transcript_26266/g.57764  ORF Transcript_26266/g.57764 Transcript_26266/m.57764 type:complete len:286 (+) Transcript_26266:83-940(+)